MQSRTTIPFSTSQVGRSNVQRFRNISAISNPEARTVQADYITLLAITEVDEKDRSPPCGN